MNRLIFVLILANLVVYLIIFDFLKDENLVVFFDVQQGESVLIKNKNNIFLYDTGKYPSLLFQQLDKYLPFYNKKIDILFLSHPDKDHYGATFEILKRYRVRLIGLSLLDSQDLLYQNLINLIKEKKIPIIVFKRGNKIRTRDFQFLILHPEKNYKKDNDNSLVIKVIGKNSYLLTGDIEKPALESLILCCQEILASDYLLVPHHGSKFSIDLSFYQAVKPKFAIIQVGKNPYGHPHPETLEFLKNLGVANILRTDKDKSLVIKE